MQIGMTGIKFNPRQDVPVPDFSLTGKNKYRPWARLEELRDIEGTEVTSLSWSDAAKQLVKLFVPACGAGDCVILEVTDLSVLKVRIRIFDYAGTLWSVGDLADRTAQGELAVGKTLHVGGMIHDFVIARMWTLPDKTLP